MPLAFLLLLGPRPLTLLLLRCALARREPLRQLPLHPRGFTLLLGQLPLSDRQQPGLLLVQPGGFLALALEPVLLGLLGQPISFRRLLLHSGGLRLLLRLVGVE
ncbi:hypothetical protein ACXKR8_048260 [Streptacidiphilus sp. PAMC 29251]